MSEQMLCFFILGLGPVVSLVIALIVDIAHDKRK